MQGGRISQHMKDLSQGTMYPWAAAVLRNSARTFIHHGKTAEAAEQLRLSARTYDFGLHAPDTKVAYGDLYLKAGGPFGSMALVLRRSDQHLRSPLRSILV